jgi:Lon protease-like protein
MDSPFVLPVFPLNTVLFPGQLLPLHIFEPRYRIMVEECEREGSSFGVALIHNGSEVSEGAEPYDVGTSARIRRIERLENGRMNIICLGESRFKILALRHDRPFLSAEVEKWPWEPLPDKEVEPRMIALHQQLSQYLTALSEVTRTKINLKALPYDPRLLANLACIALRISNHKKQDLLKTSSQRELIDRCIALIDHENRLFQVAVAVPEISEKVSSFYSLN